MNDEWSRVTQINWQTPRMPGQHTAAPGAELSYCGQSPHIADEFAPTAELYRPAVQFTHDDSEEPPSAGLYVPIGQLIGRPAVQ